MKYILLAVLLAATPPASAFSSWSVVEDTSAATVYINTNSADASPKYVTVWVLADFKIQQDTWWSSAIQEKYDCTKKLQETLAITVFAEHMGRGNSHLVPFPSNLTHWHRFVLGGGAEALWRIACNK